MEQSRKPFVTISLEEKLKASQYNTLPSKVAPSQLPNNTPVINKSPQVQDKTQQALTIPKTQFELAKEGVVVANLIEVGNKQGAILKTLTQPSQAQLAPPTPFNTTPLILSNRPQARTQFASSISLRDRLAQTSITETTHLPQYFLSDSYTGYLTITPFLTAAIQSTQTVGDLLLPVDPIVILARQDANVQTQPTKDADQVTISQGTSFINGQFISNISINEPIDQDSVLIRQGTFVSNDVYQSVIQTQLSLVPSQINQGSIELPIFSIIPEQGQAGELQAPLPLNSIAVLQGLTIEQEAVSDSVIIINSQPFVPILDQSPTPSIDSQPILPSLEQSPVPSVDVQFTTPLLANYQRQPLSLIRYQTDKLLAFGAPRIKHGSANLIIQRYLQNRTRALTDPKSVHGESGTLSSTDLEQVNTQARPIIDPNQVFDPIKSGPIAAALGANNANTIRNLATRYASLNYGTLVPNAGARRTSGAANTARGNVFSDPLSTRVRPTAQEGSFKDFITIKVGDIQFTAYLTSFSDSVSTTWNDLKYVGRQDTLKQFTGATRSISFSLLLPSLTKADLAINMRKLEKVLGATVVGSFEQGNSYITGPIPKVKIGNLLDAYCAFSSVKWDFDPAEATFDIDEGLPHLLKVSFDGAVLSTNSGKLLNGTEGGYFGKSFL